MNNPPPPAEKPGIGTAPIIVATVAVVLAVIYGTALFIGNNDGLWGHLITGTTRVLGPVLAAAIAWMGVKKTLEQKQRADYRSEWWKRVEWALAELNSEQFERQSVAIEFLLHLVEEDSTPPEDAALVSTVMDRAVQSAEKLQGEKNTEPGKSWRVLNSGHDSR